MPCDSSYLESNPLEKEASRVVQLLDELDGTPLNPRDYGSGYDKRVYNSITRLQLDKLVEELCNRLQKVDVTKYSLELQMWWRDHKVADKKRLELELKLKKEGEERQQALDKLTDYEKKLLNLT